MREPLSRGWPDGTMDVVAQPGVLDLGVGVPHARLGEVAVAVVTTVVTTAAPVTAEELQRQVRERLAGFTVRERVVFRAEPLPRTPGGKVLTRELRTEVNR